MIEPARPDARGLDPPTQAAILRADLTAQQAILLTVDRVIGEFVRHVIAWAPTAVTETPEAQADELARVFADLLRVRLQDGGADA